MKDETWNFTAALIDGAGWGLGTSLISHATFLPLFVGHLTPSPLAIGAIPAVMYLGWNAPGVLVASRIERLPQLRACVMGIAMFERSMLFALILLTSWLGRDHRTALLQAFFICWLLMSLGTGCVSPAYFKLIAKTVSPSRRGRLFGLGGALAGLLGIAGGEFGGRLLEDLGYPLGFVWCFAAAFVVLTVSVLPLAWMREPVSRPPTDGTSAPFTHPPTRILLSVSSDRRLYGLAVSHALSCGALMAAAFYTSFAQRELDASPALLAHYTATLLGAGAVGNLVCGWIGDRFGNRLALIVASTSGTLASCLTLLAPTTAGMFGAYGLAQITAVGWGLCWVNYVLEISPPHLTASYFAVTSLLFMPFRVLLPLGAAPLVAHFGYHALFAIGGIISAASVALLLLAVPEPRARRAHGVDADDRSNPGPRRPDDRAQVRAE